MRIAALLSLLAGVGSVASAAIAKSYGLPKTKKDIHVNIQADGLDFNLDISDATSCVVKPKVFIISMVCFLVYYFHPRSFYIILPSLRDVLMYEYHLKNFSSLPKQTFGMKIPTPLVR